MQWCEPLFLLDIVWCLPCASPQIKVFGKKRFLQSRKPEGLCSSLFKIQETGTAEDTHTIPGGWRPSLESKKTEEWRTPIAGGWSGSFYPFSLLPTGGFPCPFLLQPRQAWAPARLVRRIPTPTRPEGRQEKATLDEERFIFTQRGAVSLEKERDDLDQRVVWNLDISVCKLQMLENYLGLKSDPENIKLGSRKKSSVSPTTFGPVAGFWATKLPYREREATTASARTSLQQCRCPAGDLRESLVAS